MSEASNWPIAAAMIPFAGARVDGRLAQDDGPDRWHADLAQVAGVGFRDVDLTDSWLRVADLEAARRADVRAALADLGLGVPGISTARRSVVDPDHGDEYLAYSHRLLDVAPEFGAEVVSFGTFRALTAQQQSVMWFWTVPGASDDPAQRDLAVRRLRELADHAAEVGLDITLELYEDTYVGTIGGALAFLEDIGRDNVGLNPDIGNLVRAQGPIESWREMADRLLPAANYWHVKNYFRFEDPATGTAFSTPAPLADGFVDYRSAVRTALAAGYRGAICVEHYGGDGLGQAARSRDHLWTLLPHARPERRPGERLRP